MGFQELDRGASRGLAKGWSPSQTRLAKIQVGRRTHCRYGVRGTEYLAAYSLALLGCPPASHLPWPSPHFPLHTPGPLAATMTPSLNMVFAHPMHTVVVTTGPKAKPPPAFLRSPEATKTSQSPQLPALETLLSLLSSIIIIPAPSPSLGWRPLAPVAASIFGRAIQ
jgi:hypothetical protein